MKTLRKNLDRKQPKFARCEFAKVSFAAVFAVFACLNLVNCTSSVQIQPVAADNGAANIQTNVSRILANGEVPPSYKTNCAECHGDKGQGVKASPELSGLTTRVEDRRSDQDLLGIINNPKLFGLSSKMKSYKDKLTEDEKQEIIQWIKSLK
jgi:mono/diheme cytochrome c family protein